MVVTCWLGGHDIAVRPDAWQRVAWWGSHHARFQTLYRMGCTRCDYTIGWVPQGSAVPDERNRLSRFCRAVRCLLMGHEDVLSMARLQSQCRDCGQWGREETW